jgi:anthranilate phosphoribosyltransferase
MKEVAPIRKNIGVPTFFNMLGPMVNPSFPKKQLVGVFSLQLQRYYKYIYEQENIEYRIVHSLDGYDEISLTGPAKIISPDKEIMLNPKNIYETKITPEELKGGKDIQASAQLFMQILEGNGTTAQNSVVCANAAMAIQCYQQDQDFSNSLKIAEEALKSKAALQTFKTLISL